MYDVPTTGLLLSGGGARAGYQVGVLKAIAKFQRESGTDLRRNRFRRDLWHFGRGHQLGRAGLLCR